MAGLLKPFAAERLINELKQHIAIPIHLHTHDTAGIQSAMYLKAIEAGVDVIDVALSSMSGTTSQPNFNSIVSMMHGHERENPINLHTLNEHSNYWEDIRELYYPFEAELKSSTAEVYENEIPGGQYSNLRPQARGLGLEEQFDTIKENFKIANKLFGDIVKVTPSSKVVGDMAMFMTANHYTENDILAKGQSISFPESVKGMMRGDLGQPFGGFPEHIQQLILKDEKPYTDLPNAHMAPANLEEEFKLFLTEFGTQYNYRDFLSYKNYPKVFADYHQHLEMYGDLSVLPTQHFFYPMQTNEEILVEIGQGKSLLIRFMYMSEPDAEGNRHVFFKLNGQTRDLLVRDRSIKFLEVKHIKATQPHQVGAPLQGLLAKVLVKPGDVVKRNQPLFIIEAMKMESNVVANADGVVSQVHISDGTMVEQDDCILEWQ
jgi:pyruvate carboxylase